MPAGLLHSFSSRHLYCSWLAIKSLGQAGPSNHRHQEGQHPAEENPSYAQNWELQPEHHALISMKFHEMSLPMVIGKFFNRIIFNT